MFCDRNKLYCIQDKVNKPENFSLNLQDEVIISRIRTCIVHSKFTHSRLLQKEQQQLGLHILRLPTNYTTHISGVSRHISRAELTFP